MVAHRGTVAPPIFSFGAVFAEVRVDADIPIPRDYRVIGLYNARRILNPRTARSQMSGGIVWGVHGEIVCIQVMFRYVLKYVACRLRHRRGPTRAARGSFSSTSCLFALHRHRGCDP